MKDDAMKIGDNSVHAMVTAFRTFVETENSNRRVSDHTSFEIDSIDYLCHECSSTFATEEALREHTVFVHSIFDESSDLVKCCFTLRICRRQTENEQQKSAPVVELKPQDSDDMGSYSQDVKKVDCPCGEAFESMDDLDAHMMLKHGGEQDKSLQPMTSHNDNQNTLIGIQNVSCVRCYDHQFTCVLDLQRHLRNVHCDFHNKECPRCYLLFCDTISLKRHRNDCADTMSESLMLETECSPVQDENNSDKIRYMCRKCGVTFSAKVILLNHLKAAHHFICRTCDAKFENDVDLQDHMRFAHPVIKNLFCPHCSQTFAQKSHLTFHIRDVHQDIKKLVCNFCGYRVSLPSTLKTHIKLVHENQRPHACHLCCKTFKSGVSLKLHVKSFHNKIKDKMCPLCGKMFARTCLLSVHIKSFHERLITYKCSHCTSKFESKDALRRHLSVEHSGLGNYRCEACSFTSLYKNSIKKHVRFCKGSSQDVVKTDLI